MECLGIDGAFSAQPAYAFHWNACEPNNDDASFVQSLLSSLGVDIPDYSEANNNPNGKSGPPIESEAERQRREKNNLASKNSRAVKKERFAAMTGEIEQLQAENYHLRNMVQEMDSVIFEAKHMVMQANQCFH